MPCPPFNPACLPAQGANTNRNSAATTPAAKLTVLLQFSACRDFISPSFAEVTIHSFITNSLTMKRLLLTLACVSLANFAPAAITNFDLIGTAGAGLLFGNEPAVASGGTGGEIGAGITFDDVTSQLTVNVGWGSSQGFTDLSSAANNSHIHGPTANNFGTTPATGIAYTQTAGVLVTLNRSSSLVTGGTFTNGPITLTTTQVTDLFNGKYYINLHTANNGGGELRGFIVPVPEPTTPLLGMLALGSVALRRRRA